VTALDCRSRPLTALWAQPSKLVPRATLSSRKDATLPTREDRLTDFDFTNLRNLHYVTQAG
jgi:hypothetical protein